VHPLVLAMRGHIAVVPGGTELGQIDRQELIDMDELAGFAEGQKLRSRSVRDFFRDECSRPRASSSSRNLRTASLTVARRG